jgi:hypothetical protein
MDESNRFDEMSTEEFRGLQEARSPLKTMTPMRA